MQLCTSAGDNARFGMSNPWELNLHPVTTTVDASFSQHLLKVRVESTFKIGVLFYNLQFLGT